LRLRRALGHGGAGGAGRGSHRGLPHRGRRRRLEESQRAAGALTEDTWAAPRPVLTLSATARCGYNASAFSNPSGYCLAPSSVDCFTVPKVTCKDLTLVH